jgi:hypothetical protein
MRPFTTSFAGSLVTGSSFAGSPFPTSPIRRGGHGDDVFALGGEQFRDAAFSG